jgi:hypothetical protein
MAKKPARERVWEISRIKGTPAAVLGRIKAPDAESASKNGLKNSTSPIPSNRADWWHGR